ncbi:MAG: TIR domain-containing protein [Rhodomicrobium sp.]
MVLRDYHTALKSETVTKVNAGYVELVLVKLQWSKEEKAFTLHVSPSSFSTSGLQTPDWLSYLGFRRSDRCQFTPPGKCYCKAVQEGFDVHAFATAFNKGFGQLQQAQQGLEACGFRLSQPEGLGFFYGKSSRSSHNEYSGLTGDGHRAMKIDSMKKIEDDKFLFRFTFIDTGGAKGFVTHYRPKHPPLSSELRSVFGYLGLQEFKDCPEFDFEPCHFRTLQLVARDDNPFAGNVDWAHRTFDAHEKHFSPAIEHLLSANAAVEAFGMTFLPLEKIAARMESDIASNVHRPTTSATLPAAKKKSVSSSGLPNRFDVAISFAGTERAQAEELADILRTAGYSVFYDNYYPEHLWGKNLPVFFDEIFQKRARFCVIFVSKEYRDRNWTSLEARSAQARALMEKGNEYILPIRIDDTELAGLLPTVGYVPIATGIGKIGEMLIKKLQL